MIRVTRPLATFAPADLERLTWQPRPEGWRALGPELLDRVIDLARKRDLKICTVRHTDGTHDALITETTRYPGQNVKHAATFARREQARAIVDAYLILTEPTWELKRPSFAHPGDLIGYGPEPETPEDTKDRREDCNLSAMPPNYLPEPITIQTQDPARYWDTGTLRRSLPIPGGRP